MMKRIISIFAIMALALWQTFDSRAQDAIKVEAPNVVGVNEQFNVTFIIEEKPLGFFLVPGRRFPARLGTSERHIHQHPDNQRQKIIIPPVHIHLHPSSKGYWNIPDPGGVRHCLRRENIFLTGLDPGCHGRIIFIQGRPGRPVFRPGLFPGFGLGSKAEDILRRDPFG